MNDTEKAYAKEQVGKGYKVLRTGWPDFLLIPPNGSKPFAVELKYDKDDLSPAQVAMHKELKRAGLRVLLHQVTPDLRTRKKQLVRRPPKKKAATAKKTWLDVIAGLLDREEKRLSTGDIETIIRRRYSVRLKNVKSLHGTVGSALANIRKGAHPRIRCKERVDGTYVYWTVRRP